MILDDKLASGDTIFLDGAIGSEIERTAGRLHTTAWCGVANLTHPEAVQKVHESYLKAGVDIVTTNTFASARHVLEPAGYGDQTQDNIRRAVELARQAIEAVEPDRPIAVAGSMSNHVAWIPGTVFADPEYEPTPEQEEANYREWAETLAEAGCDLLIMEMMLDTVHAARVVEAATSTGLPVWIGLSASRGPNGTILAWDQASEDGDTIPEDLKHHRTLPLEAVLDKLLPMKPQVVGIMHSSVKSIQPAMDVVNAHWDGPTMAYPETNGFDAATNQPLPVKPDDFVEYCESWVNSGIQILGGCCGTTVYHIKAMTERLKVD